MTDRSEFTVAVRAQAFETSEGERIVHCRGSFTSADWDEASVVAAIERAADVAWVDDWMDHNLAVLVNGKVWRFQVQRPVRGDES